MTTEEEVYAALKYRVVVDAAGTRRYYNAAGQLHREDGPAVETTIFKKWYQNGQLHRKDGPAIERMGGNNYWYQNGSLHRVNGPAVEFSNGDREWWVHGMLHRVGGPAVERRNSDYRWAINGLMYTRPGYYNKLRELGLAK